MKTLDCRIQIVTIPASQYQSSNHHIPIDSFEIDLGGGRGGGTSGSSSVTDRRGLFGGTSYDDCLFGGTS